VGACTPVTGAGSGSRSTIAWGASTRQYTTEAVRAAEVPVRATVAFVHVAEAPVHEAEPPRAAEVVRGAAAAPPAAPATSAGTSRKRKRAFSSQR
jgi:hypothetical protein